MTSLRWVFDNADIPLDEVEKDRLYRLLVGREDGIADLLRFAGQQFGLHAEIVAEVIAQTSLGTPLSEAERDLIRHNFLSHMARLQQEWRRHSEGEE